MPNGPYQPYDVNQLLAMLGQNNLGVPSATPPPGMSPSMPWPGGPQDSLMDTGQDQWGMGMQEPMYGEPLGAYQPPQDFPGMEWMGQGQPQGQAPQQAPSGHPILDKLFSPQMADKAMAAAIFARGFVAPQEAINWAMQIRSQRQAQQARSEQSKFEQSAMTERKLMEGQAKKAAQDEKYVNQAQVRATNAGVLDEVEQEVGVPWPQWTPAIAAKVDAITSRRIDERKTQQALDKESENKRKIINDALKRDVKASIYTDPKSSKYDPEFTEQLESANKAREMALENKMLNDKIMRDHRTKMAALASKMTADQKVAVTQFDPLIMDLVRRRTALNNALTMDFKAKLEFAMANDIPVQGSVNDAIQEHINKVDEELVRIQTGQYQAAGGKGTAPAASVNKSPASTDPNKSKRVKEIDAALGE